MDEAETNTLCEKQLLMLERGRGMFGEVVIKQDENHPFEYHVTLDGEEINGINAIDFCVVPNEFPRITLEVARIPEYRGKAELEFKESGTGVTVA